MISSTSKTAPTYVDSILIYTDGLWNVRKIKNGAENTFQYFQERRKSNFNWNLLNLKINKFL